MLRNTLYKESLRTCFRGTFITNSCPAPQFHQRLFLKEHNTGSDETSRCSNSVLVLDERKCSGERGKALGLFPASYSGASLAVPRAPLIFIFL